MTVVQDGDYRAGAVLLDLGLVDGDSYAAGAEPEVDYVKGDQPGAAHP